MDLVRLLDVTEDKIRFSLSKRPIIYAFISGIGTVLFFRGIWLLADQFVFLTGWVTLGISLVILLLSGSFVFHFISNEIVISGLNQEKKLSEKTLAEIKSEASSLKMINTKLDHLNKKLDMLNVQTSRKKSVKTKP